MSMFNDMDWTKNGNLFQKSERVTRKDSIEDTVLEMTNNDMERTLISQKENETMKPIR